MLRRFLYSIVAELIGYYVFGVKEFVFGHYGLAYGYSNENIIIETLSDTYFFMYYEFFRLIDEEGFAASLFYAGFFTSMWVCLYLVAGLASALLNRAHPVLKRMVWFFDIKTKPLQSIGYVAALIAGLATWVVTIAL
jgi:hypothetical protein